MQPPHCICTDTHTQTTLNVENPAVQILENLQVWRRKNMMTSHFNILPLSKIHSTTRHWSVASHAQIYGVNMSYLSQYLYSLSCTGSFWQQSMQENLQHDLAHFKGCLAHRWKVALSLDMLSLKGWSARALPFQLHQAYIHYHSNMRKTKLTLDGSKQAL